MKARQYNGRRHGTVGDDTIRDGKRAWKVWQLIIVMMLYVRMHACICLSSCMCASLAYSTHEWLAMTAMRFPPQRLTPCPCSLHTGRVRPRLSLSAWPVTNCVFKHLCYICIQNFLTTSNWTLSATHRRTAYLTSTTTNRIHTHAHTHTHIPRQRPQPFSAPRAYI